MTESGEVDNVETSFEFCVVYVLNVDCLGPTKRRICRGPTSTHSLHLASSPVHTTLVVVVVVVVVVYCYCKFQLSRRLLNRNRVN